MKAVNSDFFFCATDNNITNAGELVCVVHFTTGSKTKRKQYETLETSEN